MSNYKSSTISYAASFRSQYPSSSDARRRGLDKNSGYSFDQLSKHFYEHSYEQLQKDVSSKISRSGLENFSQGTSWRLSGKDTERQNNVTKSSSGSYRDRNAGRESENRNGSSFYDEPKTREKENYSNASSYYDERKRTNSYTRDSRKDIRAGTDNKSFSSEGSNSSRQSLARYDDRIASTNDSRQPARHDSRQSPARRNDRQSARYEDHIAAKYDVRQPVRCDERHSARYDDGKSAGYDDRQPSRYDDEKLARYDDRQSARDSDRLPVIDKHRESRGDNYRQTTSDNDRHEATRDNDRHEAARNNDRHEAARDNDRHEAARDNDRHEAARSEFNKRQSMKYSDRHEIRDKNRHSVESSISDKERRSGSDRVKEYSGGDLRHTFEEKVVKESKHGEKKSPSQLERKRLEKLERHERHHKKRERAHRKREDRKKRKERGAEKKCDEETDRIDSVTAEDSEVIYATTWLERSQDCRNERDGMMECESIEDDDSPLKFTLDFPDDIQSPISHTDFIPVSPLDPAYREDAMNQIADEDNSVNNSEDHSFSKCEELPKDPSIEYLKGKECLEDNSVAKCEELSQDPSIEYLKEEILNAQLSRWSDPADDDDETMDNHGPLREDDIDDDDEGDVYLDDSDSSSVCSAMELPIYYPALQGSRNVTEFQCLNRVEEGTYGVVYRARDLQTGETVALKRLKMESEEEGFPITSLREMNTLLNAKHENIVTLREVVVGSNINQIYLVMEFVAHDLKSLIETMREPFLIGEVKTLMLQFLSGVAHMHNNWVIHRDLKPSNLLITHNSILKIDSRRAEPDYF